MLGTRHADLAPSARSTPPVPRAAVRPLMRPGTTDKASVVAHYEAMAQQVARDRWSGHLAAASSAADRGGTDGHG
jgi:hypothetical protein